MESQEASNTETNSSSQTKVVRRASLWRLAQKELRETLRDRRTIITLVAMPLIVYPILSLVFKTFLLSNIGVLSEDNLIRYRYAIFAETSREQVEVLMGQLSDTWERVNTKEIQSEPSQQGETSVDDEQSTPPDSNSESSTDVAKRGSAAVAPLREHEFQIFSFQEVDPTQFLEKEDVDVLIRFRNSRIENGPPQISAEVFFDQEKPAGRNGSRFFSERLDLFNRLVLQERLRRANVNPFVPYKVVQEPLAIEQGTGKTMSLASIIPLILVLMTITGAVYPAIDLTAGERERGTLETLIAAPLPRMRVLVAKMTAVITVAVLTATLNVVGMATTIWAFQLESTLLGGQDLTIFIVLKIFGLLALFATFFSAVLLVITSFARSFKEAQAYLIPVILLSLAPGLLAMTPGLSLDGPLAVCPMINLLLLSRDVLAGNVSIVPAALAVFSTLVYVALAIAAAATVFGADSILYGSQSSWKELFSRPLEERNVAPVNVALVCLYLLFPINFIAIALLGRLPALFGDGTTVPINLYLMAVALFTFIAFFAFPTLLASHQRIRIGSGFGVRGASLRFWSLAVVMGLGLWPVVMAMINGWYEVLTLFYGAETTQGWQDTLSQYCDQQATRFRDASPFVIGIAMAIAPACCEEWFFRGLFQRGLLSRIRPWVAIAASAAAFGIFHTLSGSVASFDRLIPTTVMGVVLGLLAYKANSILPGILLHSLHNASVAFIAYFLPDLNQLSWFPQDAEHIPVLWTITSAIIGVAGLLVLLLGTRQTSHLTSESTSVDNAIDVSKSADE
ncbi:MAG: ABC transporter permease subunit/CPBP intramembrane protease [Pirellulaceae bacterium]